MKTIRNEQGKIIAVRNGGTLYFNEYRANQADKEMIYQYYNNTKNRLYLFFSAYVRNDQEFLIWAGFSANESFKLLKGV
jgi:hypothetical protein